MLRISIFILLASSLLVAISAFAPVNHGNAIKKPSSSALDMGWLDGLLGKGQMATASHILLKGPNADDQCERIKADVYKKAIGRGNPANGVEPAKLVQAFANAAKGKSTCPSAKKGGSLGSFGQGQMVPEFDAVAFKKEVGVIHGPIRTDFGSHLILVTQRE